MQSGNWIAFLQNWLADNRSRLNRENIRFEVLGVTPYVPSSIHVDFFASRCEATVELWDDGLSDFHVLDVEAEQVNVTHYEFQSKEELCMRLEALVHRLMTNLALAG